MIGGVKDADLIGDVGFEPTYRNPVAKVVHRPGIEHRHRRSAGHDRADRRKHLGVTDHIPVGTGGRECLGEFVIQRPLLRCGKKRNAGKILRGDDILLSQRMIVGQDRNASQFILNKPMNVRSQISSEVDA